MGAARTMHTHAANMHMHTLQRGMHCASCAHVCCTNHAHACTALTMDTCALHHAPACTAPSAHTQHQPCTRTRCTKHAHRERSVHAPCSPCTCMPRVLQPAMHTYALLAPEHHTHPTHALGTRVCTAHAPASCCQHPARPRPPQQALTLAVAPRVAGGAVAPAGADVEVPAVPAAHAARVPGDLWVGTRGARGAQGLGTAGCGGLLAGGVRGDSPQSPPPWSQDLKHPERPAVQSEHQGPRW